MHSLYIDAEYLVITDCNFILEDTALNVLGEDWMESEQPIVKNLRDRLFTQNKTFSNFDDPVLYGKIIDRGSVFQIAELMLLSEIILNKSIQEMDKLINNNFVKIKNI